MAGRVAGAHHAKVLVRWAQPCVDRMRRVGREHGYAITTHGTMAFDIDIVAIPWVDDASSPELLISALRAACSEVTGLPTHYWGVPSEEGLDASWADELELNRGSKPQEQKPHGRVAWTWQLGGGAYVDCSVMPRTPQLPHF